MTAVPSRGLRATGALWITVTLIWLPFEDTAIWMVVVLAALGGLWLWFRFFAPKKDWVTIVTGALLGAAIPLFAITMMAVKSGLHGHGFADFTARQVLSVLSLIPITLFVGGAFGAGSVTLSKR